MLTMIPFLLGASPVIGFFMGRWLDGRLGTEPVLRFVFLGLGFVAGVRETVKVVKKASRAAEAADRMD
ncbi:MAG: AtpZ/AtpI family protein [Candidatus Eisenbacteria bacterium]|uniref:AtpZ/AtpI family protein n=1 Tax=Eiseniibacteriota bacterium TaxID=2212470 RepID=A0A7Y2ECQ0_UNCEI|nr:AtpZ/AtpI family protein [Candidatus Eisenbacteria bacterium]